MKTPLRVLIAEDNPLDAELVLRELRKAGFEPDWTRVDTEAAFAEKLHPDLDIILSDYAMPEFGGIRALEMLKKSGLDVPLIIISGTIGEENAVDAMKQGAVDYLLKDRLTRLGPAVRHTLETKELRIERRRTQQKLQLQATALQTAASAVVITTSQGTILSVNPAFTTLTGYTAEEAVGQNPRILKSGHHAPAYYKHLWETLLAGRTWHGNFTNRHKDGSFYHDESTITPVRAEGGAITHFVSIMTDVTARKRAEEELHKQAGQMRLIIEHSPAAIAMFDRDMRYLVASRQWMKAYDLGEKSILGLCHYDVFPEIPERWKEIHRRCLAGAVEKCDEDSFPRASGTINWVRWEIHPWHQTDGSIGGIIIFSEDITGRKRSDEALREAGRFSQSTIDALSAHVCVVDETGVILATNKAWERFAESNRPGIQGAYIGVNYLQVCESAKGRDASDAAAFAAGIRAVIRGERTEFIMEYACPSPSEQRWFTGHVTRFPGNGPIRVVVAHENITKRKLAEEELRWKTAFLEAQVDSSFDGILVVDSQGKKLLQNERFNQLWKIPRHIAEDPDDTVQVRFAAEQTRNPRQFGDKVLYLYAHPDEVSRDEIELIDGTVLDRYSAPVLSKDGKRFGRIWTFRDITERKRTEEALVSAEAKFRHLVEQSLVGTYMVQDGRFVYISPKLTVILGFSEQELVSKPVLDFIHAEDRALADENIRRRISGEIDSIQYTLRMVHMNGHTVYVEVHGGRTEYKGRPAVLGTMMDITERKLLEEQLRQSQKMEAIGQLAGGIAHDFNNLLVIIQGYTEMLLSDETLGSGVQEPLHEIFTAGQRAASLTSQLLTFSRRQPILPKTLDLNAVVGNVAKMLKRVLGENITVHFEYAHDLPPVHADTGMLEQVLMNLAVNARDAMPKSGRLSISTSPVKVDAAHIARQARARAGDFVRLTIRDTGCGMPPEVLDRIFEPFFTTKGMGKGTGLGLATVYGIVSQHQGWIEVDSKVGTGTTFEIFLPALPADARPAEQSSGQTRPQGGTETILLVEDEDAVRDLASAVLAKYGYRVLQAATGEEALAVWKRHSSRISLLLTDMVMPGDLNGWDLAQQLLDVDPALKVIYTSGYSDDMTGNIFDIPGKVIFLQKPYRPSKLAQTVRQALDSPTEPKKADPK